MVADSIQRQIKINKHARYIADPFIRQALYQQFTPNFCFHRDELNFPAHPDAVVKNIIVAKRALYLDIQENERPLTTKESEELTAINTFFWTDSGFNDNYHLHQNKLEFIKLTEKVSDNDPHPEFLLLDEKHYGKKIGELVDVVGILPLDHPKKGNNTEIPPCCAAITPTEDGFYIDFEFVYPLNNAITGLRWLRNILPESWCKKLSNLGFHYGDCEAVGIYVKIDDEGKAVFDGIRTWAHGRDFSRRVSAKNCTYDQEGHPCVFVGLGGHPSYADNFVGRNAALDLVGDAYHIVPNIFIDTSKDVISAAYALTDKDNSDAIEAFVKPIQEVAKALPHSLSGFRRIADSNPATFSRARTPNDVADFDTDPVANQYNPFLFFTKLWQKLKSLFIKQPESTKREPYKFDRVINDNEINTETMIPSSCRNILSCVLAENETGNINKTLINYKPPSAIELSASQTDLPSKKGSTSYSGMTAKMPAQKQTEASALQKSSNDVSTVPPISSEAPPLMTESVETKAMKPN